MALGKLDIIVQDQRAAGETRLVDLVQSDLWIVPTYFSALFAAWLWLSLRDAGKVLMFVAMILLSAPLLLYDRACLHIQYKLTAIRGVAQEQVLRERSRK